MSNYKPTTEHTEFASVQEHQGSDAVDTSASSIHGSVDSPSAQSATMEDTQTGTQKLIDGTKNGLDKEKNTFQVTIRDKTAHTAFPTSSKQPKLHRRTQKCFPGLLKSCEDRWVFEVICCLLALCSPPRDNHHFGRSPGEKCTALALCDIYQFSDIYFHGNHESCHDACCFCRYVARCTYGILKPS
jgi:hypothetical protein